jgi:hypothetical protein
MIELAVIEWKLLGLALKERYALGEQPVTCESRPGAFQHL